MIAKYSMFSLYGKFGMKLTSTELALYNISTEEGRESLKADIDLFQESIQDFIKIDNHFLIIRNSMASILYNKELDRIS